MAIAYVQSNSAFGQDFSAPYQAQVTLTGVAAGSLIVLVGALDDETVAWSVSDSVDSVNTAVAPTRAGGSAFLSLGIHYIKNAASGSHTITWAFPANRAYSVAALEYSGAHTTAPLDTTTAVANGFGTSLSTANATPAEVGELAIAFVGNESAKTYSTWLSSMTERIDVGSVVSGGVADIVLGSTSALNGGATASSTGNWGAVMALFKEGAASSPPALMGQAIF